LESEDNSLAKLGHISWPAQKENSRDNIAQPQHMLLREVMVRPGDSFYVETGAALDLKTNFISHVGQRTTGPVLLETATAAEWKQDVLHDVIVHSTNRSG